LTPDNLIDLINGIPSGSMKAYMESAVITMKLAISGEMTAQTIVRDDVLTVLGRPGTTMAEWARRNLR
jgi:NAD(P)H dehydrogenase (quinone)